MIVIVSDYSELDRELDRLGRMPTFGARMELDGVLHKGFVMAKAAVHVQTGALKASGREDSEVHQSQHAWEGDITFGSPGENGPVDYAIYEKARGLGGAEGPSDAKGDHNFIAPLAALDPLWREAIKRALKP